MPTHETGCEHSVSRDVNRHHQPKPHRQIRRIRVFVPLMLIVMGLAGTFAFSLCLARKSVLTNQYSRVLSDATDYSQMSRASETDDPATRAWQNHMHATYAGYRREVALMTGLCLLGGVGLCVLLWRALRRLDSALAAKSEALHAETECRRLAESQVSALERFPNENPDPILRVDNEGTILYGNAASRMLLSSWGTKVHESLPNRWQDVIAAAIATGQNQGREARCAGKIFFLMFSPIEHVNEVNIYAHDITTLKEAQEQLQQSNRQLKYLAATDPLTHLPNRRYLLDTIQRELGSIARHGGQCVVAMVDVDQLKVINDVYGHSIGDDVLRSVAQGAGEELRESGYPARWGGDEFLFLLRETTLEDAIAVMERLRKNVGKRVIANGRQAFTVNLSIGLAAMDSSQQVPASDLLAQADQALYVAKREGGCCTRTILDVTDTEPTLPSPAKTKRMQQQIVKLVHRVNDVSAQGIWSLIQALEARDPYTRGHAENVTRYAVGIARTMELSDPEIEIIRRAAIVHDIGKIGVPDHILLKPGQLLADERAQMRSHVATSVRILQEMQLLEREIPLVQNHHEQWDGEGYPHGISGEAIPLGARILAVADAFDAMTSDRIYRPARTLDDALRIVNNEAGKQFDPGVVNHFVQWLGDAQRQLPDRALTTRDLLMMHAEETILGLSA